MELERAYRQIEERLDRIDFPALFRGFHRYPFALYDETRAYMGGDIIERPACFLGNTSVEYDGARTAIWMLGGDAPDPDVLASKLAHEMLHAHQQASGETRWADERRALVKYRHDAGNVTARLAEAACVRECLSGHAPGAFSRLLSLRRARMERYPFEYDYEARIEQIEGTANYVELAALRQLAPGKAERQWALALEALAEPSHYFPARAVSYLSGAAFIACLRRYADFDADGFTEAPFAVAALAQAKPCALPRPDARIEACLADWQARSRDSVAKALEAGDIALDGEYRLIAWNVYDSTWIDGCALLTGFLGYIEGDALPETDEALLSQMRVINGDFVAEVDEDLRLSRAWRR